MGACHRRGHRSASAGRISWSGRYCLRREDRRIGVLYLDSREQATILSNSTRAALETLATEAAVAIENARLYRETMEKARMEQEMRIAAEIQQALLPKSGRIGAFFRAAAASLPSRSLWRSLSSGPERTAQRGPSSTHF